MDKELLYAKDAIFSMICQFHRASRFDDGELYIYNYCEYALERAFNVLGIEDNYIKLMDFCQMWEDNNRALWRINSEIYHNNPDDPYRGTTADIYYKIFKEDLEIWERWEAEDE